MRTLILADDCNPDWPSLPVVGFKAARAIAEEVETVVATHVRNRPAIEREGMGRAQVRYIDNEYIARPIYALSKLMRGGTSVGWTTNIAMSYLPYLAFEHEVWKLCRSELESGYFDVVHRLTPMSPTLPSLLPGKTRTPFVLGPLNGGLQWPAEFQSARRREREWLSYARKMHRLLPYYQSTYKRSKAILTAFPHTLRDLPQACHPRCIDFPEVGVDPDVFSRVPVLQSSTVAAESNSGPLTFLFAGRLVPYKCPDIAVRAFARSAVLKQHRLKIVGDGPEMDGLAALVKDHGLDDCVELAGWMDQAGVGAAMRGADVFVFPSIRELGAGVVVEAMASGLACVAVDYGGPGGLLNDATGVKVPLGNRDELTGTFTRALENLANDRAKVAALGQNARSFAMTELTWEAKAKKTVEVYKWACGARTEKPSFWPKRTM